MKAIKVGFKNNAIWIANQIIKDAIRSYAGGIEYNMIVEITEEQLAILKHFIKSEGYSDDSIVELTPIDFSSVDYAVYLKRSNTERPFVKSRRDTQTQVLNFKWDNTGKKEVFPAHNMVKNWLFDENTEDEATLAHYMAVIAEKSGMNQNDLQHLFPAVLRMLKNDTVWSGLKK